MEHPKIPFHLFDAQKMEPANASLVPSVPTDKNLVTDRSRQATIKDAAYHVVPYMCVFVHAHMCINMYVYIYISVKDAYT